MDRCEFCGRHITEDSNRYRRRLKEFADGIGEPDVKACDRCIKSRQRREMEDSILEAIPAIGVMQRAIGKSFYL